VAIVSEAPLEGDSYEIVVLRDRSEARGKTPGASGCRFHVSVTVHELDCAPVNNANSKKSPNKLATKTLTCDTDRTKARTPKCRPAFGCSRRAFPGPNKKLVATKFIIFDSPEKSLKNSKNCQKLA